MFLCRKHYLGSQAAQCPKGSDHFCFKAALDFIRLTISLCGVHGPFAIFSRQKWRKVRFQSIDDDSVYWQCYWARCWMLHDMDNMETRCVFVVKVGMFTQLEQSKIWLLTVNKSGIVRQTVQHDRIVSISFTYYPSNFLRQTSADILSLKEWPMYISQSCDFGCCMPWCIPGYKQTTLDRHIANCKMVGNPCNW